MAVMHPRVAHNYLKDGYYPTDNETLIGITYLIHARNGYMRALDPCCGSGDALQLLCKHISPAITRYGIELDVDRAQAAKQQLDQVLNVNTFDCRIGSNSQSLLFLNPPYGDVVTDVLGKAEKGMNRLEVQFTRRCLGTLRREGILALVIPAPSLTKAFSGWLVRNVGGIQVYRASTDRFKQVVIMGVRRDMSGELNRLHREKHRTLLTAVGTSDYKPHPLPTLAVENPYTLPVVPSSPFRFEVVQPDKALLSEVFAQHNGLWHRFDSLFTQASHRDFPRPLRKLSPWHLSLALAAGQISGLVTSNDGQRHLLVKGGTKKVQRSTTTVNETGVVTTKIDQFVPTIRAIDITAGPHFGDIIAIQ